MKRNILPQQKTYKAANYPEEGATPIVPAPIARTLEESQLLWNGILYAGLRYRCAGYLGGFCLPDGFLVGFRS